MHAIVDEKIIDTWRKSKDYIIKEGLSIKDGSETLLEVIDLFLVVTKPEKSDEEFPVIDQTMKKWMLSNFNEINATS